MNRELLLKDFGKTILVPGAPPVFASQIISEAAYFHGHGPWGNLLLQEIETSRYLLRHYLFSLKQPISFFNTDENNKLQSLLAIDGCLDFEIKGHKKIELKKRQFLLFVAGANSATTTLHKGSSSILNTHYAPGFYKGLVPYFADLKKDLKKAIKNSFYISQIVKVARPSVHDAIKAIWEEKYIPALQAKHIELRLESSLFTMFAQTYSLELSTGISLIEREYAEKAEKIILQDLKIHLTPKEIAEKLNCSASWLRKTFRKVHGVPMFHFLRSSRMHYARVQILSGAPLKAVARDLGMNPSNFPKEFKAFFGQTVSEFKKGLH